MLILEFQRDYGKHLQELKSDKDPGSTIYQKFEEIFRNNKYIKCDAELSEGIDDVLGYIKKVFTIGSNEKFRKKVCATYSPKCIFPDYLSKF